MHVLILNQTFYPDVAATAQHMWDLAQHLAAGGHRVTAITSRTIYGTEQHFNHSYEKIGPIEIHRVAGTAFGKKSSLGRMCDFFSFYLAAFVKLQEVPRPDVILALTSPPMIAAMGLMQRHFDQHLNGRRLRLVYHVMDLYPDAAVATGVLNDQSLPVRILQRLTRRTLAASDAVVVLGRDMAQRVLRRYRLGTLADRLHIVPPWADGIALNPLSKSHNPLARALGVEQTFNIVYSGNLGIAHDLKTITGAIEQMRHDPGLAWLFIGGGHRFQRLQEQAAKAGWSNVRFLPYQDRDALNQSLNLADVHLVSQLPAFTGIVVPSKLYGIMAVGRPTVMIGPADAECSRVVAENEAGFVVPNEQVDQLVACLRKLQAEPALGQAMGQRARQAFDRYYDRSIACAHLESILQSVVKS